ncbi:MAG: type II toxin-antitoxin system HicA family toxin [Calothrix sp. FI2-JRJ7]|jgi:hypothetical protein|nr:type II toxin-antitoxin system HicA family toxin [Calothrix sp. FI2-JRJ7]
MKSISGKQLIYQNPTFDTILSIPMHKNKDLKVETLKALMKIADLTEDDYCKITTLGRNVAYRKLGYAKPSPNLQFYSKAPYTE